MPSKIALKATSLIAISCTLISSSVAQQPQAPAKPAASQLERDFLTPPETARPRVWWHWMNGNITRQGIALDLEWMKRTGLGGFQNFDAALNTPKVVDTRLVYMDPGWKDAFNFAITKGKSLGFEMAIAGSPGWSETGGPWVTPEQAMKKYVWSEIVVEGGKPFTGKLASPPIVTGPFQTRSDQDPMGAMVGAGAHPPSVPDFYKDSVVIAYKQPSDEAVVLTSKATSSSGEINAAALSDNDLMTSTSIKAPTTDNPAWIQLTYSKPETIQSFTFAVGGPVNPLAIFIPELNNGPMIEGSEDGTTFTPIARIPTKGNVQQTLAFMPRTLRAIRVVFAPQPSRAPSPDDIDTSELGMMAPTSPPPVQVAEFAPHTAPRVHRFEDKAAFTALPDNYALATPHSQPGSAIDSTTVIDLTSKMQPDGTLTWDAPAGTWTIVRMGYSLTGITNHPAPPEATGPEVDKLNKAYVTDYMNKYLDNYKAATSGKLGASGVGYVITDSWEAGTQNWTNDMLAEFQKRRGYSATPYLPVLTGHIVNNAEDSDRFLWDFRKTIADLVAENHYGTIADILHSRGMKVYGESHESGRATIGDGMEMKRYTDVPMAAMWTRPGAQFGSQADIRESASVAHIYGQNLVAAESLTSSVGPWAWSPAMLKPTADLELASGLNRFVIHESAHQPLVGKAPGLALGPFGQWFNRNEIWAEQATPWITYLARNSYLLQQGRFSVADIAYFYGEDSNLTAIFTNHAPDVPVGYNFDYINADALINKLSVKDGNLVTPSGMTYRILVLDPYATHMSLPVLRKLRDLAVAGATIYGPRPTADPSLGDDAAEYKALGDQVWCSGGNTKLHVFTQEKLSSLLENLHTTPDFGYTRPSADTNVLFVHRHLNDGDLYFLDNRNNRAEQIEATFRVTGKTPELWHADTGRIEPVSYRIEQGQTTVPLTLDPNGTVFVVFRKLAAAPSRTLPATTETSIATVSGDWKLAFEPKRGAPATITLNQLASWSDNADAGVKYFSGHGTYTKTIEAPAAWFKPGAKLSLDLGDVANLAEVKVNGKPLGIVWKKPFRVDLTGALHPGPNTVEITVANLWVNRLIGDAQPDATTKYTFTTRNPYKANSKLLPSGLIGPVQVIQTQTASK